MRIQVVVAIVLACACRTSDAEQVNPESQLSTAGSLFQAGKFHDSAVEFQRLIAAGYDHPDLFLNLGNAHFLADELPQAILAYRRGLRQHPLNSQLWENLEAARDLVGYPDDAAKYRPEGDGWPPWLPRPSPALLIDVALVLHGLAWLVVCAWLMLRRRWIAVVAILFFATAGIAGGWWCYLGHQVAQDTEQQLVIVAVNGVTLRRGNGNLYPRHPQMPIVNRGMEARLVIQRGGWVHIQFPDGSLGWLPRAAVLLDN